MGGQVHGQAHGCSRLVQGSREDARVRQARHNLSISLSFVAAAQDPELEQ